MTIIGIAVGLKCFAFFQTISKQTILYIKNLNVKSMKSRNNEDMVTKTKTYVKDCESIDAFSADNTRQVKKGESVFSNVHFLFIFGTE